jgi:hypothetical protein
MKLTTRINIEGGKHPFPVFHVQWTRDEDEMGWDGDCFIWDAEGKEKLKGCKGHKISLRQCNPIGLISVTVDPCKGGALKWRSFEGTGLTERDLFWAAAWALSEIERYHAQPYSRCKE